MARRPGIYGPYRHGNRHRIICVNGHGIASVIASCATEEEARNEKRKAERELSARGGILVEQAIETYELHQRAKGNKPRTIETTIGRLEVFFGELALRPLLDVGSLDCKRRYQALAGQYAVDTHRNILNQTRTFFNWCKKERYIKRNPIAELEGEGKRKKGKPQLRIDESRTWIETALERRSDPRVVAAMVTILMGMRASEVVSRVVRDLDDGGRLLWIPDSKTESGKRTLEVPEVLQPLLVQACRDKLPEARIFLISRYVLRNCVREICEEAGVKVVGPQSMRGTHSSLAVQAGATGPLVAAALGHSSFSITEKHYLDPSIGGQAKQRATWKVLEGKK